MPVLDHEVIYLDSDGEENNQSESLKLIGLNNDDIQIIGEKNVHHPNHGVSFKTSVVGEASILQGRDDETKINKMSEISYHQMPQYPHSSSTSGSQWDISDVSCKKIAQKKMDTSFLQNFPASVKYNTPFLELSSILHWFPHLKEEIVKTMKFLEEKGNKVSSNFLFKGLEVTHISFKAARILLRGSKGCPKVLKQYLKDVVTAKVVLTEKDKANMEKTHLSQMNRDEFAATFGLCSHERAREIILQKTKKANAAEKMKRRGQSRRTTQRVTLRKVEQSSEMKRKGVTLPSGWTVKRRECTKNGSSRVDFYYFSPEGRRFQSLISAERAAWQNYQPPEPVIPKIVLKSYPCPKSAKSKHTHYFVKGSGGPIAGKGVANRLQ